MTAPINSQSQASNRGGMWLAIPELAPIAHAVDGSYDAVHKRATEALLSCGGRRDTLHCAELALPLAESLRRLGRPTEAVRVLDQARPVLLTAGALGTAAWNLWAAGNAYRQLGQFDSARAALLRSTGFARTSANGVALTYARAGLAEIDRITGRYEAALMIHGDILRHARQQGDARAIAWALEGIAQMNLYCGDNSAASIGFSEAAKISFAVEDKRGHAWALRGLGEVLIRAGRGAAALDYLEQAESLFAALQMASGVSWVRKSIGDAFRILGHADRAIAVHRESNQNFSARGDLRGAAFCTLAAANDARTLDRPRSARYSAAQAFEHLSSLGITVGARLAVETLRALPSPSRPTSVLVGDRGATARARLSSASSRQGQPRDSHSSGVSLASLTELEDDLVFEGIFRDVRITAIAYRVADVCPGSLACAIPGATEQHLAAAVRRGASALLCPRDRFIDAGELGVPILRTQNVRRTMARISASFYGWPARSLTLLGVTGTNGKGTVATYLQSIMQAAGTPTGYIGTLSGPPTTPEAPQLHQQLARMRDTGLKAVTLEVSSHALRDDRIAGISFRAAVFTQLGVDHLDAHGDAATYFRTKCRLFEEQVAQLSVVNVDDPFGRQLATSLGRRAVEYSIADVSHIRAGASFTRYRWRGTNIEIRMPGRFNVMNSLAAATTAAELGLPPSAIAAGLAHCARIPGRFESVEAGQPFKVVIDFAHTPDALEAVLRTCQALGRRVITVVGAEGEKDVAKRQLLGSVASRFSDSVVITTDHPRNEDPQRIVQDILAGATAACSVVVQPDRSEAIRAALRLARTDDIVLIAGKGHEKSNIVSGSAVPFDERAIVVEFVRASGLVR